METTVNGIIYTHSKKRILEKIDETIYNIQKWIDDNNYQIKGDINLFYKNLEIGHLSKNQEKKIQKYCYWINKRQTLKKVNSFFSILSRYFGYEKVHIKISLKEETIQKARNEWIKSRNESERLLKIYKEEKGNFYKR